MIKWKWVAAIAGIFCMITGGFTQDGYLMVAGAMFYSVRMLFGMFENFLVDVMKGMKKP